MTKSTRFYVFVLLPLFLLVEFALLASQPGLGQWLLGLAGLAVIPIGVLATVLLLIGFIRA